MMVCFCFPMLPHPFKAGTVVRKVCCSTPTVATHTRPMIIVSGICFPIHGANDGLFWFSNAAAPIQNPYTVVRKVCCSTPIVATPTRPMIIVSGICFPMHGANDGLFWFSNGAAPIQNPYTVVRKVCCLTPTVANPRHHDHEPSLPSNTTTMGHRCTMPQLPCITSANCSNDHEPSLLSATTTMGHRC